MTMKTSGLSACLIHRDDENLGRAVESIRPYVDEVCIVDTGSVDGGETARSLADRFEFWTGCNDEEGRIADFGAARKRSFELATRSWILWLDSDDVVAGGANIAGAIDAARGIPDARIVCPYEYAYDPFTGECRVLQDRERIVRNDGRWFWEHPVHETLVSWDGKTTDIKRADIVWKHQRMAPPGDKERNLRILRRWAEKHGADDGWTLYQLGTECYHAGLYDEAIQHLSRYVELSGWDDQRALACMTLTDCAIALQPYGEHQESLKWARRAVELRPDLFETHFKLASVHMLRGAMLPNGAADLRATIEHCMTALQTTGKTPLASKPLERSRYVYEFISAAHESLGDWDRAVADTSEQIAREPENPMLLLALSDYEARRRAKAAGPMAAKDSRLDVVIACCETPEAWDPTTPDTRGIGGSETAVIEMAKRLAAMGARVRVFNRIAQPGLYDGVEYRSLDQVASIDECDLLIAWRYPRLLEYIPARTKWLWVHDVDAIDPTKWCLYLADRIMVLSEWHRAFFAEKHPEVADKLFVTRNGLNPARFDTYEGRNDHRAIYSSSPDRGLEQMVEMWPKVRAVVPDAELHVFYSNLALWPKILERARTTEGVVLRGRVDQWTLAREMKKAGVWVHPSWMKDRAFTETSCIGAMEALAAGMRIVSSPVGAIPETTRGIATLIAGDARTAQYQEAFVAAVIDGMTSTTRARTFVDPNSFSWDPVAEQWHKLALTDVHSVDTELRWAAANRAAAREVDDPRPVLHMALTPNASGVIMDAENYGNEAMGGGSRLGYLGLLHALHALGKYRIRALSTWRDPYVERDGIEYVRLDQAAKFGDPDVLFAYYDTAPLRMAHRGTLRIASHHTYIPYQDFEYTDVNTAPSQHALDRIQGTFGPKCPKASWYVLPNGVPEMPVERRPVPGRILYHTSPDRGLNLLLGAYPEIKRRVPGASLHVLGPVGDIVKSAHKHHGALRERIEAIRDALPDAEAAGDLTLLGRLSREDLLTELAAAGVFAFPCAPVLPTETFSLSVMECCKLGVPVVLTPADALEGIYGGSVSMVPAPAEEHMAEFVDAVVQVLTAPESYDVTRGQQLAAQYTFEMQAAVLDRIIETHLAKDKTEAAA